MYRWGRIGQRISDLLLINTVDNKFESMTQHGANDVGGPGNGDMGQAFDFDLDGNIDVLSGSEGGNGTCIATKVVWGIMYQFELEIRRKKYRRLWRASFGRHK